MSLHVGTMGWSYDFWAGNLYPLNTKQEEFLSKYSKQFSNVEIDSTFYRTPSAAQLRNGRIRLELTLSSQLSSTDLLHMKRC
jgi:uncharacterized protein YecE (DUF72 family)